MAITLAAQTGASEPPGWLHPYVGLGASGSFSDKFGQHKPGLHLRTGLGVDVAGPLELTLRGSWHLFNEDKWFRVNTSPGMDVYVLEVGLKCNFSRDRDKTRGYMVLGTGYSGYSWNTTLFNQYSLLDLTDTTNHYREGVSVSAALGVEFGSPQRNLRPFLELGLLSTVGRQVWEFSYLLSLSFGFTY